MANCEVLIGTTEYLTL